MPCTLNDPAPLPASSHLQDGPVVQMMRTERGRWRRYHPSSAEDFKRDAPCVQLIFWAPDNLTNLRRYIWLGRSFKRKKGRRKRGFLLWKYLCITTGVGLMWWVVLYIMGVRTLYSDLLLWHGGNALKWIAANVWQSKGDWINVCNLFNYKKLQVVSCCSQWWSYTADCINITSILSQG